MVDLNLPLLVAVLKAELHVLRKVLAFLLGQRGHYRQQHFALGVHRIDGFLLKEDRDVHIFELSDVLQAIQRVTGKPADRLSDDHVDMLVYSLFVAMLLTACSAKEDQSGSAVEKNEPSASTSIQSDGKTEQEETKNLSQNSNETVATEEITEMNLQMKIGDTYVQVDWADNESVEDLKNLCKEEPLVIQMSM